MIVNESSESFVAQLASQPNLQALLVLIHSPLHNSEILIVAWGASGPAGGALGEPQGWGATSSSLHSV